MLDKYLSVDAGLSTGFILANELQCKFYSLQTRFGFSRLTSNYAPVIWKFATLHLTHKPGENGYTIIEFYILQIEFSRYSLRCGVGSMKLTDAVGAVHMIPLTETSCLERRIFLCVHMEYFVSLAEMKLQCSFIISVCKTSTFQSSNTNI
jgi:hypothetical protein